VPKRWGCVQQSPIDFIAVAVADLDGACSYGPSNGALARSLYHRHRSARPSSVLKGLGCVAQRFAAASHHWPAHVDVLSR